MSNRAHSLVCFVCWLQRDRLMKTSALWAERQAARKRVLSDDESVEWINTLVYRFWQYYEPGR